MSPNPHSPPLPRAIPWSAEFPLPAVTILGSSAWPPGCQKLLRAHLQQQMSTSSRHPGTAGLQKCRRQPAHGGRDSTPTEHKRQCLGLQGKGISVPGGNCSGSNSFVCRSVSRNSTEKSGLSSGLQREAKISGCGGELGAAPVPPQAKGPLGSSGSSQLPDPRLTQKQGLCPGFESHLCVLPAV